MATVFRFDSGQFELPDVVPLAVQPNPRQRFLTGMEDARPSSHDRRQPSEVTPLDERLQPCGAAFIGEAEWRSSDMLTLWHARPVRAPYLAVDLPLNGSDRQRVILRVTHCESFGLDYAIRGDVMGS
jgi:hypothetical protein